MKLNFEDTKIIRDFESLALETYLCKAGIATISWGVTGPNIKMGMKITEDEAKVMFMDMIEEFSSGLDSLIKITLTKNQYIACLSLAYNIGINAFKNSTLLKKLNASDLKGAADQFLVWNKINGVPAKGLKNRRAKEREIFLKG